MHDIGKPVVKRYDKKTGWTFHNHNYMGAKMIHRIFKKLRLPLGEEMKYVRKLVDLHMRPIVLAEEIVTDSAVRRLLFDAGVDIIKFQTFKAENLVSKTAKQAEYQKRNIGDGDDSQYDMLKKLELSEDDHRELITYCQEKGIRFWSTAFDSDSMDFLHTLQLGLWKIPSGEITNYPFLCKIASYNEDVVMSTGMCEEQDIQNAIDVLLKYGLKCDE